jgi:hypothetical protein
MRSRLLILIFFIFNLSFRINYYSYGITIYAMVYSNYWEYSISVLIQF